MNRYVCTIGFFDGVHRGHQSLLHELRHVASLRGEKSMVLTFFSHPRQVLTKDFSAQLLSSPSERKKLIEAEEIDLVHFIDFNKETAKLTSTEFMQTVLRPLGVDCLLVGYDHHFGSDRQSGFADYVKEGAGLGIDVVEAKAFESCGVNISSSTVRRALAQGDVTAARQYLGRPYAMNGTVVEGHHVGRIIGFPTANIMPLFADQFIPANGAYVVDVEVSGTILRGMLNIGVRPTVANGPERTIEVHILDFEGHIYGQTLKIYFLGRLRSEQHFESIEMLRRQLASDAEKCRKFKTHEII